jgi:hypothetical protein
MKLKLYCLSAILYVLLFTACGGSSDTGKPIRSDSTKAEKKIAQVPVVFTWDQLNKTDQKEIMDASIKGEEDRVIIIEGYLSLTSSMYTHGNSIRCNLYQRYNQASGMHINLELTAGKDTNQMETLPEKYKTADFKVRTNTGQIMGEGTYVKVTGALSGKDDDKATLYVIKIEKANPVDPDYSEAQELKPETLADLNNKLVYISGNLQAGYLFGFIAFYYPLDLKGTNLPADFYLTANIKIGTGNSQIEELPEKFTNKDIKIRDYKGKLLPSARKVKVIGMYSKSSSGNGGSIYVEQIIAQTANNN